MSSLQCNKSAKKSSVRLFERRHDDCCWCYIFVIFIVLASIREFVYTVSPSSFYSAFFINTFFFFSFSPFFFILIFFYSHLFLVFAKFYSLSPSFLSLFSKKYFTNTSTIFSNKMNFTYFYFLIFSVLYF